MELAANYMGNRIQQALETCNIEELLRFYTDDAEVKIIDRDHPPHAPLILRGQDELRPFFEDVFSRPLKHKVEAEMINADRLAYTERCQYPDGKEVVLNCICSLREGKIEKETIVQAWDN